MQPMILTPSTNCDVVVATINRDEIEGLGRTAHSFWDNDNAGFSYSASKPARVLRSSGVGDAAGSASALLTREGQSSQLLLSIPLRAYRPFFNAFLESRAPSPKLCYFTMGSRQRQEAFLSVSCCRLTASKSRRCAPQ